MVSEVRFLSVADFLRWFDGISDKFPLMRSYVRGRGWKKKFKDDAEMEYRGYYGHGEWLGFLCFAKRKALRKFREVCVFEVRADRHGQGIGSEIIDLIAEDENIILEAINRRAQNFYVKNGFEPVTYRWKPFFKLLKRKGS